MLRSVGPVTSYTEMQTLAGCEQRWHYKYVQGIDDPSGPAARKGTMLHAGVGAWWNGERLAGMMSALAEEANLDDPVDAEVSHDVAWLLDRYVQHYGQRPPDAWRVESVEQEFEVEFVEGLRLRGRIDTLVEIDGGLWVVETKSYSKKDRIDIVMVDPQMTAYVHAAREMFPNRAIDGVLFDGIYTYRWKRDVRDPAESFERIFLDRTDEQIWRAQEQGRSFRDHRTALLGDGVDHVSAMRNLSPSSCNPCPYKRRCHDELLFGHEIELVDDEIEGMR